MLLGLVALAFGAELVVRFGARLARQVGIPPMVVGLTVVSLGTSAPELAVAIESVRADVVSLTVGDLAGSNMANLLLLLGISATFRSIQISSRTRRLDLPAMAIAVVLLWLLTLDGALSASNGIVLLTGAAVYTVLLVVATRKESRQVLAEFAQEYPDEPVGAISWRALWYLTMVGVGITAILFGADWLVGAAVELAVALGVSDSLIGLTVVALGTSTPELATTVVALVRREPDIGLGNLIGSSILNMTLVLGVALLFTSGPAELDPLLVDLYIPLVVVGTIGCAVLAITRRQLSRREGVALVVAYVAYFAAVVAMRG